MITMRSIQETDRAVAISILENKITDIEEEFDHTYVHDRLLELEGLGVFYDYLLKIVVRCPMEYLPAMMLDAGVEI